MIGTVTLLGAGPGKLEWLTLLGERRLKTADVVVYDRLVNPSLLSLCGPRTERIDVGKMPHHHRVKQTEINDLLVDLANQGKMVVRLKAGDPYVFGRGGEEAQYLKAHQVPFEVIPGLTSALAGLTAVGIPITHRDLASSFHVITGHHQADGQQLDWQNVAHQEGTLVFLMGMAELSEICDQLIANGRAATTPVAIIQWATQWRQKMVIGTLADIVAKVAENQISSPALIVVGKVVQLSAELNHPSPLASKHVLLPYSQQAKLASALQDQGADVDFYERRQTRAVAITLPNWSDYDTLLINDSLAYQYLVEAMLASGMDQRIFSTLTIVATNTAVAKRLEKLGIKADAIKEQPVLTEQTIVVCQPKDQPGLKAGPGYWLMPYEFLAPMVDDHRDFSTYDAIVFPSSLSVIDLMKGLTLDQREQVQATPVWAMGEQVMKTAQQNGFEHVGRSPLDHHAVVESLRKALIKS